ncbi:hypothetical protein [Pseudoxanthomonas sp. PXM02]|uniref:hypothetical protein n=1 Tax=Pseudoxanthomonas sp. PXM02 TaxID=2769294 RepID=UPI00177C0D5B|nr:hypothetical protein [Pseudoxanthomonas sp. PXM02]MBD9478071.1 hypothetical protein [Pseudoxanthomonas sp. PXM02]
MTIVRGCFAACVLLLPLASLAAPKDWKTLSEQERKSIVGKSASIVVHEPRETSLFGVRFMVTSDEEKERIGVLLADPEGRITDRHQQGSALLTFDMGDAAIPVSIPGLVDPAPAMATDLLQHLKTLGVIAHEPAASPVTLPATLPRGIFVADTDVDELIARSADTDLVLDVQTHAWQISRNTRLTGIWFTYISRMTLLDKRTGTVLLERDCSAFARHKASEVSALVDYLADDMAMLKRDVQDVAGQCKARFIELL